MEEAEVIVVNNIPEKHYNAIIYRSVRYAMISAPFTFNRMGIESINQKILNIAKGKIAELLFRYFCWGNNIAADFDACTTPFYQPDQRDFILNNYEWDLKNNFLYHHNELLTTDEYTCLPALIPANKRGGQWNKRQQILNGTAGVKYLFTFLKNGNAGPENNNFLQIHLTPEQNDFILKLYEQFHTQRHQPVAPFTGDWFWEKMKINKKNFSINCKPHLIITGYADENYWHLFAESGEGAKSYCNRLLHTRINNRFTEIKNLPSFLSLQPHLKNNLQYATFRTPAH